MKTIAEIAKNIGITKQRLEYHAKQDGFPPADIRKQKRRFVRYYNEPDVKAYWEKFQTSRANDAA